MQSIADETEHLPMRNQIALLGRRCLAVFGGSPWPPQGGMAAFSGNRRRLAAFGGRQKSASRAGNSQIHDMAVFGGTVGGASQDKKISPQL